MYGHFVSDGHSTIYKFAYSNNINDANKEFGILASGYNKIFDRKIAEALYIKELKPTLNEQKSSYVYRIE